VATERQIAANRRNAIKSSGPKTSVGKQRASANSYRHGLSVQVNDGQNSVEVEALARRMLGDFTDQIALQYARSAARAHLDLVRIRQIKVNTINWAASAVEPRSSPFKLLEAEIRYLKLHPLAWSSWIDAAGPIPSDQEACSAEALRQLLPELRKLCRYEARAYAIKSNALREISLRMSYHKIQPERE
jgi:hypothetical protein